jgi:putative phage-type endonuclease
VTAQLVMTQKQVETDRGQWMKFRREGVTASEIPSIVGLTPEYGSAWSVYRAKVTGEEFDADSDATLRGKHLEPYVADRYADEHPELRVSDGGLFRSNVRPWQMATPDRLAYRRDDWGPTYPVQIKTSATYDGWGEDGSDVIPVMYRVQCYWELDVTGAPEIVVPCLFMTDWKMRVYRIVRTPAVDEAIRRLRDAGEDFYYKLQAGIEPEIDWSPATTRALKASIVGEAEGEVEIPVELAERYKAARRARDRAERQFGQAQNEILHRAGTARYVVVSRRSRKHGGRKVATISRSPRRAVNNDILRLQYPDVDKAVRVESGPVTTLHPGSWSKNDD